MAVDSGIAVVERAYAKINLVLAIKGRRPDGYHQIDSLMHTISLADQLTVKPGGRLEVTCRHPLVASGPGNIVYKAALALQEHCGVGGGRGAHIAIEKNVPVEAGLGGGSSDAATALKILNRMWQCGLSRAELARIGSSVGADVPFFVYGGAARVGGIGEVVESIPALEGIPVLLIPFEVGLSTAAVYRAYAASGETGSAQVEPALKALQAGDIAALGRALANDLEPVAVRMRPEVARARDDLLQQGAAGAAMSGSGPTVFGIFQDRAVAARAYEQLKNRWPGIGLYELCGKGVTPR